MKNRKKKILLISILIIAIILGQVGVTNILSYAQNALTNIASSSNKTDTPSVNISIEKSKYLVMLGDKIEIKANIDKTGLNEQGDHPDKLRLLWLKPTGGRPYPYGEVYEDKRTEEEKEQRNLPLYQRTYTDTDTLTIDSAKLSDSKTYFLIAYIMRWNEAGGKDGTGAYEALRDGEYPKEFRSAQFEIVVLPEIQVGLLKDKNDNENRLKPSEDGSYTLELGYGEEYKLNLDLYRLKNGSRVVYEQVKGIKWESSNEKAVSVTQSGGLKAKSYSSEPVTITATVTDLDEKSKEVKVNITVKTVLVNSVVINQANTTLKAGEQAILTATVNPNNASDKTVTWKLADGSLEDEIITINNKSGLIKAKNVGETKVVAMAGDKTSNPVTVTVEGIPVTEIVDGLSNTNIPLLENDGTTTQSQHSLTIHAKVLPENATNQKIEWSSTNDNIATVVTNADGSVATFKAGKYVQGNNICTIIAKADNGKIERKYRITVQDHSIPITSVVITTTEGDEEIEFSTSNGPKLHVGETIDLNFKVNPSTATFKDETWFATSNWTNPYAPVPTDVISIDDSGVVTANAVGKAYVRILVTCESEGHTHSTYVPVQVVKAEPTPPTPVTSVQIQGEKTIHLTKEDPPITLTAKVTPENATNKTVTWTSNKPEIAEVDSVSGKVTPHTPGKEPVEVTITATADGKTDTCTIIVDPIKVESLQISDITLTIKDNIIIGQKKLTVTPYPKNADNFEIKWESEDSEVIEVREDGTVVPKKPGTTVVRARLVSDPGIHVGCQVTVLPSKAQVVVYTVDQHTDFISGITLRLTGKDERGTEIEPKELTTNGKFDFGELPDGDYTIETIKPKTRSTLNAGEITIIDYVKVCSFKILNGQILYSEDLYYADSIILKNIVDYPDEVEEGKAEITTGENYKKETGKSISEKYIEYDKIVPAKSIIDGLSSTNITLVENKNGSTANEYSLTIHPEVLPENATNKEITWTSSDDTVATVRKNDDGSVSFIAGEYKAGNNKCKITATVKNNTVTTSDDVTRIYDITVVEKPIKVDEVTLKPTGTTEEPIVLKVGEKLDFDFIVDPANATYKQDRWTVEPLSDSPANVISVDESGVVTANAVGEAYVRVIVTCQYSDCPTHNGVALVKVIPTPVTSVEIEVPEVNGEKTVTLQKDTTTTLTAKVLPEDATYKTVTWTSDNEGVATVDSVTGEVTAHQVGKATITATADGKTDTCIVEVPDEQDPDTPPVNPDNPGTDIPDSDEPGTDSPDINEPEPSEPGDNSNNPLPDTSDMPIVKYIVMMVGSFMAIAFIILKNEKFTKKFRK